MADPFPIRWSWEAWEALYPLSCKGWKPWPHWPEPKPLPTGAEAWEAVQEFYRNLPKTLPPPRWDPAADFERLRREIAYEDSMRFMAKVRRESGGPLSPIVVMP